MQPSITIYHETLSPAERLLVLTVKDDKTSEDISDIRSLYSEVGDDALVRLSRDNKLLPVVAHGLMEAIPEEELPSHWIEVHRRTKERVALFFQEVDQVASLLAEAGAPVVLIENGGIAHGVYRCHGCFVSSDLEILVDRQKLPLFDRVLIAKGYEQRSRERCASEDPRQWDRDIRGWENYGKSFAEGIDFWLNLQWQPVLRRWLPMERGLTAAELISRSVPAGNLSSHIRILAPEDNLLVCALHTASHSYVRGIGLRLQLDVDRLVRRTPIDWDVFLSLAKSYRASALVFPSLAIPKGLFHTPVPDEVLQSLIPSPKRRDRILNMIAQASVFNRGTHKFNPVQIVALEILLSENGWLEGFRRVLFPPADWIREGYSLLNNPPLYYCYADRLIRLAKKRYA